MTFKNRPILVGGLFALCSLFFQNAKAQTVLLCDSFEQYNVGLLDTQSVVWNSWGGASEDSKINTALANSGTKSVRIYASGPAGQSDIVTELGNLSNGVYEMEMSFYVNSSSSGYFNLMHEFNPSGNPSFGTWAIEVYMNGSTEVGELNWGTANSGVLIDTFSIDAQVWNHLRFVIDLDIDSAYMWCNNNFVAQWQWSYGNSGVYQNWDAIDLYSAAAPGTLASCWFDDICVTSINSGPVTEDQCTDFDSYTIGNLNDQSTIWNSFAGDPEDSEISDDESQSGDNSLYIHDSGTNGISDIVTEFGDLSSGVWEVSFTSLVPSGSEGYFNLLHFYDEASPSNTEWAIECFLNGSNDTAALISSNALIPLITRFQFNSDAWNDISIIVDLDNDRAMIKVNGSFVRAWVWSAGSSGVFEKLGALNFYSASIDGLPSEMYVDDFCLDSAQWNCPETVYASFSANPIGFGGLEWEFDASNSSAWKYIWDFDDGDGGFTYMPVVTHVFPSLGSYNVSMIAQDECLFKDTTELNIQVVGLDEFSVLHFEVYPNPSNGSFEIEAELGASGAFIVNITDLNGQILWSEVRKDFSGQYRRSLDLELPAGIYIIQIQHDRGVRTKRLVIQ